jgi:hypothetical protein
MREGAASVPLRSAVRAASRQASASSRVRKLRAQGAGRVDSRRRRDRSGRSCSARPERCDTPACAGPRCPRVRPPSPFRTVGRSRRRAMARPRRFAGATARALQRDQPPTPATNDAKLRHHMLFQEVHAYAQRLRCLRLRRCQPRDSRPRCPRLLRSIHALGSGPYLRLLAARSRPLRAAASRSLYPRTPPSLLRVSDVYKSRHKRPTCRPRAAEPQLTCRVSSGGRHFSDDYRPYARKRGQAGENGHDERGRRRNT